MDFSLGTAFSGAALLLAITSPIITSVINSHTQKREREAAFFVQRKAEILENYVRCTGQYIRCKSSVNAAAYGAAYGEMLLYLPEDLRQAVTTLDSTLDRHQSSTEHELTMFNAICTLLSQYAPRIKDKKRKTIHKQ